MAEQKAPEHGALYSRLTSWPCRNRVVPGSTRRGRCPQTTGGHTVPILVRRAIQQRGSSRAINTDESLCYEASLFNQQRIGIRRLCEMRADSRGGTARWLAAMAKT
jgi:hypothetical protein